MGAPRSVLYRALAEWLGRKQWQTSERGTAEQPQGFLGSVSSTRKSILKIVPIVTMPSRIPHSPKVAYRTPGMEGMVCVFQILVSPCYALPNPVTSVREGFPESTLGMMRSVTLSQIVFPI